MVQLPLHRRCRPQSKVVVVLNKVIRLLQATLHPRNMRNMLAKLQLSNIVPVRPAATAQCLFLVCDQSTLIMRSRHIKLNTWPTHTFKVHRLLTTMAACFLHLLIILV